MCSSKSLTGACCSPKAALCAVCLKLLFSVASGVAALWVLAESDAMARVQYCQLNRLMLHANWYDRPEGRTDIPFSCMDSTIVLPYDPYGVEFSMRYTWGMALLLCVTVWLAAPFALVALCRRRGRARSCLLTVWPSVTLGRAIGVAMTGVVCTGLGWYRYSTVIDNAAALLLCYLALAAADVLSDLPVVAVLHRWAAPAAAKTAADRTDPAAEQQLQLTRSDGV